jgi:hypothetical protein
MSDLIGYFQGPKIDSEKQLRDAQVRARSYSSAQEAQARSAGFASADAMAQYMRQKQNKTGGTVPGRGKGALSGLLGGDALSWHPTNTLNRASGALRSARER